MRLNGERYHFWQIQQAKANFEKLDLIKIDNKFLTSLSFQSFHSS